MEAKHTSLHNLSTRPKHARPTRPRAPRTYARRTGMRITVLIFSGAAARVREMISWCSRWGPDDDTAAALLGKGTHGGDGRRFVIVGTYMHALHAEALVDRQELRPGEVPLLRLASLAQANVSGVTKSGSRMQLIQENSALRAGSKPSLPGSDQKPSRGGTT